MLQRKKECLQVRNKILLAVLGILGCSLAVDGRAETWYVANHGNDSNLGTSPDQPWQSVDKVNRAIKKAKPGYSVLFNRGDRFDQGVIQIRQGGTPEKETLIGAYGSGAKPVFDGQDLHAVGISLYSEGLNYVRIENITIRNPGGYDGIDIGGNNLSHITLSGVNVFNKKHGNGIAMLGVDYYTIENSCISHVATNGIFISSKKGSLAQNGLIRNNVIDCQGASNDGITIHEASEKDGGFQAGPNHVVEGNIVSNCDEQGIDITSGSQVVVRNNVTFDNKDGGVLTADRVTDILIDGHFSLHDSRKMGAVIINHDRVKLMNSWIVAPYYHALVLPKGSGFEAINNMIVYGPESKGAIVDVGLESKNILMRQNTLVNLGSSGARFVRYLSGATVQNTSSRFEKNIWWDQGGGKIQLTEEKKGEMDLTRLQKEYSVDNSIAKPKNFQEILDKMQQPRKPTEAELRCLEEEKR
ncbi:MAG: right-handed parallel beta-helix repeat-containing protein [Magnetococcus sp. DMHC-6]